MRKTVLIGLAALVAVGAIFVACGGSDAPATNTGGDGQTNNIRIGKGLMVANIGSDNSKSAGDTSAESQSLVGNGAAAPAAAGTGDRSASSGYASGLDSKSSLPAQQSTTDNTGITVQGYGSATADADSAIVEFGFGSNGPVGITPPVAPGSDVKPTIDVNGTVTEITRSTLQPVIDALKGAGVAEADIELLNQGYYDPYYSSATLRATIKSVSAVDGAVTAAQNAAGGISGIYLSNTNVSYTLNDCTTLEKAAMQAAVEDAHDRASILANVLSVTLGSVSGASDYSYSPYGTSCGNAGGYYYPYPIAYNAWRAGGTGEGTVQVVSQISVTYDFQ